MSLGKEGIVKRSNDWVPVVIALVGHPSIKQTKNLREIEIVTKPEYQGRWTENGIHCKSGIMCSQENVVIFYGSDKTKHNKYGFRINGRSVAVTLYKMNLLARDQVGEDFKSKASLYISSNDSKSPILVEVDDHKRLDVPINSSSSTHSTDQNSSLYILHKLQELESEVTKLKFENRKLMADKAKLESQLNLVESNVTSLSKTQHEHNDKFENLKKTGLDMDIGLEEGTVLLQSKDFTEANSKGQFFLLNKHK